MSLGLGLALGVHRAGIARVTNWDTSALALFDRFTTPPTHARKQAINTCIVALKAAGVWSKLDALWIMAAADSQAARRNWIADQYNPTTINSPAFAVDRGFTGNGTSSYLTTGLTPSLATHLSQNSLSAGVWPITALSGVTRDAIGTRDTTGSDRRISLAFVSDGRYGVTLSSTGGAVANSAANDAAFYSGSRESSTSTIAYKNGASIATGATASSALPAREIFICCINNIGTPASFSSQQYAASFIGSGLTAAETLALYNAVRTYLQTVGAVS